MTSEPNWGAIHDLDHTPEPDCPLCQAIDERQDAADTALAAANAEIKRLEKQRVQWLKSSEAELAAEKDRVRRLREALPYASHLTMCDANRGIGRICTCGWKDLLRDLGGPRLPEQPTAPAEPQPFDEADNMCPNCVTPWKCNGPHLSEQTAAAKRAEPPGVAAAEDLARRSRAPAEPRWPSGEVLAEALHGLHTTELWHWWEPQPDGGAIVRKGTSPEFAAAILAALHPGDAG